MIPKFDRLILSLLMVPIAHACTAAEAEIEAVKAFPVATDKNVVVWEDKFDTPESTSQKLPAGYRIMEGGGRNGTSALFYERTDPAAYPIAARRLAALDPGKTYEATVWVRGESIKATGSSRDIGAICVEYVKDGKWVGGSYHQLMSIGSDWEKIAMTFQPPADAQTDLKFYLRKQITGKIWYDDAVVRETTIPPAILLTRPNRLSFFGDDTRFQILVDASAPKNARIWATVTNAGASSDLLLQPGGPRGLAPVGSTFHGNAGTLKPGPVEIVARLADMDQKTIVAQETFQLEARPATDPPKNACTIDEFGRAIVGGKPFMPLGVYGFADEKNYRRLSEAGFNCLQLYNSLGLRGNVDRKDPIQNVREGLDLIDRYGLKLIFSLKDQFPHRGARKTWGTTEGIDAVSELAVQTVKDHPALLAWYISDEEPRKDVPLVVQLRRLISRIDPWHPVWTLTDHYSNDFLPYYGISGDVIGVDPYPISEKPVEQSIAKVKTGVLAGRSTGLPVWVVPQIFNWGSYRLRDKPEEFAKSHFPTLEEMRAMTLYAAALGSKGFVFYSNFDICQRYDQVLPGSGEREWAKVVEMVKPLRELEPFVLSTKKPLEIAVESDPPGAVEAGALLDDQDGFRVIVIGVGGKAKGTFMLPDELLKLKREPLKSKFGKTKSLGNGRYEFIVEAVDSDVLE